MDEPHEPIEEPSEHVAGGAGNTGPEERSYEEAIALYEGEWVLMKVTVFDASHEPEWGIVIAHSPDRGAISAALRNEPPRSPDAPYQPYYTFNAFPRLRPGETQEEAAVRVAAQRAAAKDARLARRS